MEKFEKIKWWTKLSKSTKIDLKNKYFGITKIIYTLSTKEIEFIYNKEK